MPRWLRTAIIRAGCGAAGSVIGSVIMHDWFEFPIRPLVIGLLSGVAGMLLVTYLPGLRRAPPARGR
jgi:hypothetical protein